MPIACTSIYNEPLSKIDGASFDRSRTKPTKWRRLCGKQDQRNGGPVPTRVSNEQLQELDEAYAAYTYPREKRAEPLSYDTR